MECQKKYFWILIFFMFLTSYCQNADEFENAFEFISAADMRFYVANEEERSAKHFVGALEALKTIGAGSFMVSTGDVDPPDAVREAIDMVLGEDYIWYPIIGNHELENDEYLNFLRDYNKGGVIIANAVKKGPPGCEETTFSFDWANCHFVALNQYFDGKSDTGTDGDVVPELLKWLEEDLKATKKKHIFVFGHEPLFPMPDMDSGRMRHYDDSVNKYMENNIAFIQMMRKYNVKAYVCGHTHNASFCNINGLWQIDTGHSRGLEGISPDIFFEEVKTGVNLNLNDGLNLQLAVKKFYMDHPNQKDLCKSLDYLDLIGGLSYKEVTEQQAVEGLIKFYVMVFQTDTNHNELYKKFWKNANYARSTFIKFYVSESMIKAEFYRDDGRGGDYSLMKTLLLY